MNTDHLASLIDKAEKYYSEDNDKSNYYLIGVYYEYIERNYEEMKKYYLMDIDKNMNSISMTHLANYYRYIEKNHLLMKKYYLMAHDANKFNTTAITNLGSYYQFIEKNHKEMLRYYTMAIEKNDINAMYLLGNYYRDIKNYVEMKKYYFMTLKNDPQYYKALTSLGHFYDTILNDPDNAKLYYTMAIKLGDKNAMKCIVPLLKIDDFEHYYQFLKSVPEFTQKFFILINKYNMKSLETDCSICSNENVKIITLECCHSICLSCIMMLSVCPYCSYVINKDFSYKTCHTKKID